MYARKQLQSVKSGQPIKYNNEIDLFFKQPKKKVNITIKNPK